MPIKSWPTLGVVLVPVPPWVGVSAELSVSDVTETLPRLALVAYKLVLDAVVEKNDVEVPYPIPRLPKTDKFVVDAFVAKSVLVLVEKVKFALAAEVP